MTSKWAAKLLPVAESLCRFELTHDKKIVNRKCKCSEEVISISNKPDMTPEVTQLQL